MKLKITFLLLFFSLVSFSQNFDSFASGIKIYNSIYNVTASAPIHNINQSSGAQNFQGVNLGTFGANSTCAKITGSEVKTFKNLSSNVCSVSMNWRVYQASATPSGSFNTISLATISECDLVTSTFNDGLGPCANRDQKWKDYTLNTNFINGLLPGNYVLEIFYLFTGSNSSPIGCETTKFINNSGNNFKATFTISNPVCNPTASPLSVCEGSSLNLSSNPSGGVAPYSYVWSGPNGFTSNLQNPTINNIALSGAGIYSLIITDACGVSSQSQNTQSVVVNEKIVPTFDAILPAICRNGTPPVLSNTSSNFINGTWSPSTVSNTATGTYVFTPDPGQCASVLSLTIFVVNNVAPTFTLPTFICVGSASPALSNTSNNGIVGTWNPTTISNTTSGSYTFTPNVGQCATPRTFTISVQPNVTPTFTLPTFVCNNGSVPNLPTTSNNGITGTWSPTTVSNTTSGTYTFTPTSGLCATIISFNISVNPNITPTFNAIAPICANANAPLLQGVSNNGISGTWSPNVISNTTSGTYTFTPNSGQCATNATINVIVNPNITPTFDPIPNVCYNTAPPLLPSNSTNGITGTWNPATISNTASGNYTFTPTSGLCATTATISVTVNIVNPTFAAIAPICSGSTAPALQNPSSNGISGTWNSATVNNTASGTYTFTPNAGQCATNVTIGVTVNPIIVPTFNTIAPFCANSTAPSLQTTSNNGITGGWSPSTVSNTASGSYLFTPQSGQCASQVTINVVVTPNVTPTFNNIAPFCQNTTAPVLQSTSNNGINGTWNPAVVSNTNSGTYTFTPNSPQCANVVSINIVVTPNVTPTFNYIPPFCSGTTAPILQNPSNNGISGTWNPSVINNSNSGSYTFTPNGGQCATNITINVTVTPNIIPTFNSIPPVCYGSSAPTLQNPSNNGISGTWNPSVINNLNSGTYTFTPNNGQCAINTSISVTVNTIIPTFNNIPPICNGSPAPTLQNTSNNGISGTWEPQTISNTIAGTYTFTPNSGQCATTVSITTTVNAITPTFNAIPNVCYNSSNIPTLQNTSNNGISGTWSPTTVNNISSGNYTFTPNSGQCATQVTITINVNSITPVFNSIAPFCANNTAPALQLTSNNGITGIWSPSTISNTSSGTYTFTPNANQCALEITLNVVVNPNVEPTFDAIPTICYNSSVPVLQNTSNNGISGTWSPTTISNTVSGNYTFTPNSGQCATIKTITVNVNIITPTFNQIPDVCYNSTVPDLQNTSNNGISGTWNPSVISNTVSGSYTFTPNPNQCATNISLVINVNTITPSFNIATSICENQTAPTLETTSINGITGVWIPSTISNTNSGSYTFSPNANQCAVQVVINITVNPTFTPTFSPVPSICENADAPVLPTTSNNGITGSWSPFPVSNIMSGTYTFTADANQCVTNTIVTLNVVVNTNNSPTFNEIPPICENATPPVLPTTSNNGITGSWSPFPVSNTASGTYTFTTDANQCVDDTIVNLAVTVIPNTIPIFDTVTPVCSGSNISDLPTTSNNGVTGTWSPAINNTQTTTYTFTPNGAICATSQNLQIVIIPNITPIFDNVLPICENANAPVLPTTSNNGITGSWSPFPVSNTSSGTYTFTPDANQCVTNSIVTLNVIVNPNLTPSFNNVAPICENATPPVLPTTSNNGISGTWVPFPVSNTTSGTYTFTPNPNQCVTNTVVTLNVTVTLNIVPVFNSVSPVCSGSIINDLPVTSNNGITGTWSPAINNTQTTTYTFIPNGAICATSQTLQIVIIPNVTPIFDNVPPICENTNAPVLPTTSNNGITGGWSPFPVSNTSSGTYTFTPYENQCVTNTVVTLNVIVNPNLTPSFNNVAPICENATSPVLPTTSNNGIIGSWSPFPVSNTTSGTYTFTPDANQCVTNTVVTLNVTVTPNIVPVFNSVSPVCSGSTISALPLTSNNGIIGTWSPAINNTQTTTYTFTPNGAICATSQTLQIVIIPNVTPTFNTIPPVCNGTVAPILPLTSNNGVSGTWNPSVINTSVSGNYTFTPNGIICALPVTIQVVVINPLSVTFVGECQDGHFDLEVFPSNNSFNTNTSTYVWQNSGVVIANANTSVLNVTEAISSTTQVETYPITYSVTNI